MKHVADMVAAYLGGELTPEAAAEIDRHLQDCSACRREFEQARRVWSLLDRARLPDPARASAWPQIRARTFGDGDAHPGWFFGRGPWTRAGWATAAIAAGVMLGVLGSTVVPMTSSTTAAAAEEQTAWLESTWLDTEVSASGLADLWLAAGGTELEDGS